jgi:hypothetical protein
MNPARKRKRREERLVICDWLLGGRSKRTSNIERPTLNIEVEETEEFDPRMDANEREGKRD